MTISEEAQEIMNDIYIAYGTGTGIIFGITSPKIVGVIIQFSLDYLKRKKEPQCL